MLYLVIILLNNNVSSETNFQTLEICLKKSVIMQTKKFKDNKKAVLI